MADYDKSKSKRGLGSPNMSESKKKEIQRKGGQASPQNFRRNRDLASQAGRKGGQASRKHLVNPKERQALL